MCILRVNVFERVCANVCIHACVRVCPCRYDIDASQELVALGTANMVGSMFQTVPAMAGFGMSALNAGAGAKSQLSLCISGVMVGVIVVLLQSVIYYLPTAVLSSVIIMSVSKLVDWKGATALWAQDKSDLAVRPYTRSAPLNACVFLVVGLAGSGVNCWPSLCFRPGRSFPATSLASRSCGLIMSNVSLCLEDRARCPRSWPAPSV